jgi:hypothetical protein
MEAFALYLIKSVSWLTGFALVYIFFLRNERYFELNRLFLVSGIAASLILPLLSVTYTVILPAVSSGQTENITASVVRDTSGISSLNLKAVLFFFYLSGILFIAYMILKQGRSLLRVIRKAGNFPSYQVKLVKTDEYDSAFSFFSWVFVNPSFTDVEIREIMNHEMVHIRQKHWLDLILAEFLCLIQWFNPVIWIYIRLIRQNHEYIADKVALQRTSDPAVYKAALLNQIVGSSVISLANSFNYSLNTKRFKMMENIFNSPYRKMKLLLILPVFAIVFYAFAKPDYQYSSQNGSPGTQSTLAQSSDKKISGKIMQNDGKPLQGAHVIIINTTIGTITDEKGNFSLENVPPDAAIAVTYVGFKSKVIKSEFVDKGPIKMERDTINLGNSLPDIPAPPPPPPPPPPSTGVKENEDLTPSPAALNIRDTNGGPPPLIVLDGVITDKDISTINPETVESMTALKNEFAIKKYGDKGKNGAIEITSKKAQSEKEMFVAVEELPQFPGGSAGLQSWIRSNLKHPADPVYSKINGKVYVTFIVTSKGKVSTPMINKSLQPILDLEAIRLISSMPNWKPGTQDGKAVDVQMMMPVEF